MTLEDELLKLNKERGGLTGMAIEIMMKNIANTKLPQEERKRNYDSARNWMDNVPGDYPLIKEYIEQKYKGEQK